MRDPGQGNDKAVVYPGCGAILPPELQGDTMKRLTILAISLVLAIAGLGAAPLQAHADDNLPPRVLTAPLDGPDYPYINIHSGPGTEYPVIAQVPASTDFWIGCWGPGTPVTGPYGTTDVWYEAPDYGGWASDADIWTGSNEPVTQGCGDAVQAAAQTYDRHGAAQNALTFADTFNFFFDTDCTYFVSLSLWDGGGLMPTEEWTNSSTDEAAWASKKLAPGVTKAAINANEFTRYMERSGTATVAEITWSDNTASGAELGDVIAYDWDTPSGSGSDGTIDHLAIVTGFTPEGYPLVSQHSPSQVNRYWSWSLGADNWIEFAKPGAKAYLIHIVA